MSARATPKKRTSEILAGALAAAAGVLRLVPHPWGVTPVPAAGLLAGAKLPLWSALGLMLLIRGATDLFLQLTRADHGSYAFFFTGTMTVTYGSLLVNVLLGHAFCTSGPRWRVPVAAFVGAVQFFVVTNFYSWLSFAYQFDPSLPRLYEPTWDGLVACYVAGLAFCKWSLVGDVAYACVLFGVHGYLTGRVTETEPRTAVVGESR